MFRALWIGSCVAAITGAIALTYTWRTHGLAPIAVRSGSMEPSIPVHALIFVESVPASDIRTGDVITFDPPGSIVRTTHRVVERTNRGGRWYFRTRGDANPADDDWRRTSPHPDRVHPGITYGTRDAIRYRFHVPQLGRITALGEHPRLRLALILLPFAMIAIELLARIWRPRSPAHSSAASSADEHQLRLPIAHTSDPESHAA